MGQMGQAEQVEEAANAMPNPLRPMAVSSGLRLSLLDRERLREREKEKKRERGRCREGSMAATVILMTR